jgi:tetratricopeptide (TPR) repeat protein
LERILAAGAADTTGEFPIRDLSTFLWVGAYAVDRGNREEYAAALDRQRARARDYLAQGYSLNARRQEATARALEGYALWKRGQKTQAIRALETAQRQVYGGYVMWFPPNVTVRWWLGELMLEVDRPRDAERYLKSLPGDPFAALRLGKVYEDLGEFEEARASYEYALLSWQHADPELQPRIQEARQALARLPKPIRRE